MPISMTASPLSNVSASLNVSDFSIGDLDEFCGFQVAECVARRRKVVLSALFNVISTEDISVNQYSSSRFHVSTVAVMDVDECIGILSVA